MDADVVKISGRQLSAFLEDRLDGLGPCRVQEDLEFSLLAGSSIVPNARRFMAALDGGGTKLTAKGNLNRKFVEMLLDRLQWHDCDAAEIRAVCKTINERDFPPAMYLHAILRLAGIVRSESGLLKLTKEKGFALLPKEKAGLLQALLFRATFARYNLAYLDGFNIRDVFAPQVSLILYLIGKFCTDWTEAGALKRSVTFPAKELTEFTYPELPVAAFEARVLRYLCWFGLMEQSRPGANDLWRQPRLYRKTPLYERMLQFVEPG
jgi:hypothetical protein